MYAQNSMVQTALRGLMAVALVAPFASLSATPSAPARLLDLPAERRIELLVGAADAGFGTVIAMPRAVTLHRFRAEFVDAAGRPTRTLVQWSLALMTVAPEVSVVLEAADAEPMARLSADHPELRMPRPFGVRLAASDSLRVIATVQAEDLPAGSYLRLTLEYESEYAARTRLPVRALAPRAQGDEQRGLTEQSTSATRAWDWRTDVGGRLVAISGPALACADALMLEDAVTGAVLWRTRLAAPVPTVVSGQRSEVIRPGVVVERGRLYRLRAEYRDASELPCGTGTPTAMLIGDAQ